MTGAAVWSDAVQRQLTDALIEHAPAGAATEAHLRSVITETAARPGKLFRARLVFATTTAHGIPPSVGLPLATAVEYFHAASLLFDDLPCMDNATTRRGAPCPHHVHGEATAILGALAFINRAYALTGFALLQQPAVVRLKAQACLDACLGTAGLVGGQARDLRFASSDRSLREVTRVAVAKTGAMLSLSLLLPALLAAPHREEVRALEALCLYWTLALQGLDDLGDVLTTSLECGKTTGRDRALARPNLAVALGVPHTRRRIHRLLTQADRRVHQLIGLSPAWSYLQEFHLFLVATATPVTGQRASLAA